MNTPVQTHSAQRRTCDALGLCQGTHPACAGCSHHTARLPQGAHYFAPGTIDRGTPSPMHRRTGLRAAVRWVGWVAGGVAVVATLAAATYTAGIFWERLGHVGGVL